MRDKGAPVHHYGMCLLLFPLNRLFAIETGNGFFYLRLNTTTVVKNQSDPRRTEIH